MNLSRITPIALCLLSAAAYAEAGPTGGLPPQPQQQQPHPQMMPGMNPGMAPHVEIEIHLVTLDSSGAMDAASQKTVDDLAAEGWRPQSMSTVSSSPVTLAIMFGKTVMPNRPMPQRPPQQAPITTLPPPVAPTPAPAPAPAQAPVPTPAPAPAPAPAGK